MDATSITISVSVISGVIISLIAFTIKKIDTSHTTLIQLVVKMDTVNQRLDKIESELQATQVETARALAKSEMLEAIKNK